MLCCKIFVLKYFRRTSTLRKFLNTKIFLTKISRNENFPIYGIDLLGNRIFVKTMKAANQPSIPWASAGAKAPLSELYCINYRYTAECET